MGGIDPSFISVPSTCDTNREAGGTGRGWQSSCFTYFTSFPSFLLLSSCFSSLFFLPPSFSSFLLSVLVAEAGHGLSPLPLKKCSPSASLWPPRPPYSVQSSCQTPPNFSFLLIRSSLPPPLPSLPVSLPSSSFGQGLLPMCLPH